jgi:hypothetical protein
MAGKKCDQLILVYFEMYNIYLLDFHLHEIPYVLGGA